MGDERRFRPTLPPVQPASVEQRLWQLEHAKEAVLEELDQVVAKVDQAIKQLEKFATEKELKDKSRAFWIKFLLTVLSGLTIAGFTWIAAVMNAVQRSAWHP